MIVTLSTANCQSHPRCQRRVQSIDDILNAILFVDNPCFIVSHVVSIESRGDPLSGGRIHKQISRKLLNGKLIEWHITVERINDPVTPQPNLSRFVSKVTIRVGVAGCVQPTNSQVFAKVRRCQQTIDSAFVITTLIIGVLVRRWRKTGQSEAEPSQQALGLCLVCQTTVVRFQTSHYERVNRMINAIDLWHRGTFDRLESPVLLILGPLLNPLVQYRNLCC